MTNVTAYYRDLLDRFAERVKTASLKEQRPIYTRSFIPNPEKTFHRGATDYFLHGRTRPLANWNTPKSTGEYIGQVLEARGSTLRVRLEPGVELHNGDGLTIGSEGFNVNGVEGNLIRVNKTLAVSHWPLALFRNLDVEFVKSLHSERRIPVDVVFRETADGFELRIGDKECRFTYPHEPARDAEKALNTIRTQLTKLGDTPYVAREVTIDSRPYFIPISILNEWRRSTII